MRLGSRATLPALFGLLVLLQLVDAEQWDARNFPNPTSGDFQRCGMRTNAAICDPDSVLSEADRNRLNYELQQLETRTRQDNAPDFCQKKGISAAMAIVKNVRGGTLQAVKEMANEIKRSWNLDSQCQKVVVFVMATEDKHMWMARDDRVPVVGNELDALAAKQLPLFKQGNYKDGLLNVIRELWNLALSKKTPGQPTDRGFQPQPPPRERPHTPEKPFSMPAIPMWMWIALICVVLPTLCCCCCLYFCCCRKKDSSSPRRQDPSDYERGGGGVAGGGGGGGRGGGMFGSGARSFLGGLGGAGIGNLASNFFNKRRNDGVPMGGMGGGGGFSGGGSAPYYPPEPAAGGGALYPNISVQDEGGGVSWADDKDKR